MSPLKDPIWIATAKRFIGLKEIPGPKHNPIIVEWAKDVSSGAVADDETAWCGTFVGAMLSECNLPLPKNPLSARGYLSLSKVLDKPAVGCIVVFWRDSPKGWTGHVGFVLGKDKSGRLMVLSGNQGNAVTVAPYTTERLLGYRWPSVWPLAERFNLPIIDSKGMQVGGSES